MRRIGYLILLIILLCPVICYSQTPILFDTWRTSAPLNNPVIKISPDKIEVIDEKKYNSFPSALLPRAEDLDSSHVIKVNPRTKVIGILKVTYDSGTAKGRIFFQRGQYSGIACLKFWIFDNGSILLGGTIKGNGAFKTLEEAEAASLLNSGEYEYPLLNNVQRIAMFATLKDPALVTEDEALKMIGSFRERATKIIKDYFASSPSERKRFMSSFSKIPVETAIGQKLISDLFIEYGYDLLRLPEAVSKFRHNVKVRKALDDCNEDLAKLLKPFIDPPKQERPKAIVKLAPDLIPPDGEGGNGMGAPPSIGISGDGKTMDTRDIAIPQSAKEVDPAPDDFIAVSKEAKPLQDIQSIVQYPEIARRNNLEGKVAYMALIGKDGKVQKVNIIQSDNQIFNDAVIKAVRKTRFTPARQGNEAMKTWFTSVIKFKLN